MEKYINLETHVRPNDSMSIMTIEEMLKRYTDGYSREAQVELVRCRDCKYWKPTMPSKGIVGICEDTDHFGRLWKPDDFCSYGERKVVGHD